MDLEDVEAWNDCAFKGQQQSKQEKEKIVS
jgi:hypothetical protein